VANAARVPGAFGDFGASHGIAARRWRRVNVAALMEQVKKRFGTALVATEATVVRASEVGEWQEVGREAPRDRSGAVRMLVPSDLVLASRPASPHEQRSGADNGGAYG
jgi:hypothetical protein